MPTLQHRCLCCQPCIDREATACHDFDASHLTRSFRILHIIFFEHVWFFGQHIAVRVLCSSCDHVCVSAWGISTHADWQKPLMPCRKTPTLLYRVAFALYITGPLLVYAVPDSSTPLIAAQVVAALACLTGGTAAFGAASLLGTLQKDVIV